MTTAPAHEVFSINLIRRQAVALPVRKIGLYVAIAYLALQILWTVVLVATGLHAVGKHWGLKNEVEKRGLDLGSMSTLKNEVEALQKEAQGHVSQFNQILALEKARFPMAGKWAALTETLPSRTWIKRLSGNREKRLLQIQAVYLVDPQKPFDLPVKIWIASLKKDPRFGTNLKRLDLETSSRTDPQAHVSLYTFDLAAEWNPL